MIVSAGVILHESLKAAKLLEAEGINVSKTTSPYVYPSAYSTYAERMLPRSPSTYSSKHSNYSVPSQFIQVRVIDIFTVSPIDKDGLIKAANESNNTVLTVEEHYYHGGIYGN